MKTVILSGGIGYRLRPLTNNLPKTMVPIAGKPLLQYHIELSKEHGIKDIIMCLGYLPEKIQEYFGDGSNLGVRIRYSTEKEPLGTGGPLALAKDFIDEDFFLLNGDIMCNMNIRKLEEFHRKNNALVSIVVHESSHPEDSDLLDIDLKNKVKRLWIKPHKEFPLPTNISNAGAYFCSKEILDYIELEKCSFEREIIPRLVEERKPIFGYKTNEYLIDIGTYERLQEVENKIKKYS